MSTTELCQQEARLADLFSRQREAEERKDREGADALFLEIWAVLDIEEGEAPCSLRK